VADAVTVLIADDHPPTRSGVRDALETAGYTVVAEARTGTEAVELALEHSPDVCLLDIHMPRGNGVDATAKITAALPDTAVVMLTVSREDDDLFSALRAGAVGYLLKDIEPDRLPNALAAAVRGEAALPRSLVNRLVDEFRGRGLRRITLQGRKPVDLSGREWEVLKGLREGLTTAQIAGHLSIAPVTVRSHIHTLLRKLRVPDRDAALRLFEDSAAER
jgi:DNA-binding NarL/FixJ family response regulator